MSEKTLSGRTAADGLLATISNRLNESKSEASLTIIQVGSDPASASYIRQKKKASEKSGVRFVHCHLPSSSNFLEIKSKIEELNGDQKVTAFMLQLPLDTEKAISKQEVSTLLNTISPKKDADGLHVENQGQLMAGESTATNWTSPIPATALGIMRLIEHYKISLKGKNAVVVGRSRLVGLPTAILLSHEGATVTICHRHTKKVNEICARADLIVVAAGQKHLIKAEHVHSNTIIIDVGIHVKEDGKLTGDASPEALEKCKAYTPVPGGVGPMTVAGLVENAARLSGVKL
ncbi:bifunctional 5,10-methylenetetrahydrofolate dehydrogenase/5,10-methenyltetrahydrofolate cyclohydrolase [bacterium]|nr:bifunctional 5,10-methylenetetrahydrofolate dehydrogenase/5,10-methenyltetrahydrofolate cyclohydrolase [bacterium]